MSHNPQSDFQDSASNQLPGILEPLGKFIYQGSFSDVYKGVWTCGTEKADVCIKVLRKCGVKVQPLEGLTEEERFERRIRREVQIWRAASHKNVVPLIGYQMIDEVPWLVSPWINKGSLMDYLRLSPGVSRIKRLKMLEDSTTGLAYLHGLEPWIAHGDLKPENILVLDDCTAALCDFGTSRIMADISGHTGLTTSGTAAGTAGYQAKELILGDSFPTTSSDIYALGGVILWAMSGEGPFYHEKTKARAILAITSDKKCDPEHHPNLEATDPLWQVLNRCWEPEPKNRPSAIEVSNELAAAKLREPPPYSEGTIMAD